MVDAQPGMKAVLVRDGDYYIGLRDRAKKARKHDADLFVSIHADAFTKRSAKGSSVYVLSRRGASSEHARWLASRENGADMVGGVSIRDKDDTLAAVMLDLQQNAALEASFDVAGRVLQGLGKIGHVHKKQVQQAGFVVLKSPDIPSILVETAFISNHAEERKLRSATYKQQLAKAVLGGIQGYFSSYRPDQTVASR
jgi:N-acetylmuramoyl-L-alanine amidase